MRPEQSRAVKKIRDPFTYANSKFRGLVATPENAALLFALLRSVCYKARVARPRQSHSPLGDRSCSIAFTSKLVIVQTYDILMAIVLLGTMVFGALKGFAWQLASIASIVVSYAVAYHYREPFSQNIHAEAPWNRFLAMLILYVVTSFLIWVAFRMIAGSIDRMKLKEFDRQIGAIFALGKGAMFCTLITLFAVTLLGEKSKQAITQSRSGRWIARLLDQSDAIMPEELAAVVQPYLEHSESQLGSGPVAQPWLAEASPAQSISKQLPGPQWSPNPAWSTAQSAAPNTQRPPANLSATPQWQQAAGPAPWQR